jgi:hypothetical protein
LLARLVFIMTEVANLPFDADEAYEQGLADYIATLDRGNKEAWQIRVERERQYCTHHR